MFALLNLNEHSRRGRELAPALRAALYVHGIDFVEGSSADDITSSVDCIIAAGGDGTIVGAAALAIACDLPLGIVPLGTFNDLARTLEIPLDVEGAVAVIAGGIQRAIDVGRVNGRYFVNEASIGISSRISRIQTPELKQRFGFLGVIGTALQAYRHSRAIHCSVSYDGTEEAFRTIQLTIANSNRFGGLLNVADAAIDDGWLDLYSVDIDSFFKAIPIARALLAGRREPTPGLRTIRATRFRVRTRRHHRIAADGEPAGTTPAVFEVLPKALRIYVRQ
jgi:YegS/Rv2252/BmrU family lipid kinase